MKKQITNAVAAVFLVVAGFLWLPVSAAASNNTSSHQFLADVNADGNADAVTFDPNTGDWWVALSNGTTFGAPSRWISGFGVGTSKQFLANVGGSSAADAVTYDKNTGDWWVALSNGINGFEAPSRWMIGHGVGSKNQLLGDINGDGKADAVVFFDNGPGWCSGGGWCSGSWWAATSNLAGTRFDPPGLWFMGGLGVGSTNQFVADVDGDGKADAVVFFNQTGQWWVSNSDGIHFASGPNKWASVWGYNSPDQLVGDVNGDGKSDAFIADAPYGNHDYASLSNGSTFSSSIDMSGLGAGNSRILLGDVNGDGKADLVVFDMNTGDWWAATSNGTGVSAPSRWISGFGVGTD